MLTRKLTNPSATLIAALVAGLLSQTAAATDEIVVYGTEAAVRAQQSEALFQSEMQDYVQSLNQRLKTALDEDLKRITAPRLRLAASKVSTRG